MRLHLVHPEDRLVEMRPAEGGFFEVELPEAGPGTRYFYRPGDDARDYPDPQSRFQPEGVHGPSEVVDPDYPWKHDAWRVFPMRERVIYELHIGAFTPEGTFEAAIARLPDLVELGVNTLELMPVSQFPGDRNWGYDGAHLFAPQNSYGGPTGLKAFIDACHGLGLNVLLDVVYNHWGPEGNYIARFGPYFTDAYKTPWGSAVNLDGPGADGVRDYLCENLRQWFEDYRFDGVRVDAIHALHDESAHPFWHLARERLNRLEERLGRRFVLIAESDLNDPRVVRHPEAGGLGFDAQWMDDFHHALYALIDDKGPTHFEDFGTLEHLCKAYTDGFVHSGEYVRFRKRRYGASSAGISGDRFVAFIQNHDQVGNRIQGERLSALIPFARLKVAAAAVLLSPYVPLLFMGEEYAEDAPFLFFSSHSDPDLVEAVREGRKTEFQAFNWGDADPVDPFDVDAFQRSKLRWETRGEGRHRALLEWHKALLALRAALPALKNFDKRSVRALPVEREGIALHRLSADRNQEIVVLLNLSARDMRYLLPQDEQGWVLELDSEAGPWLDPASASAKAASEAPPREIQTVHRVQLPPWSARVYLRSGRPPGGAPHPHRTEARHVA
jgi:maltooligosyltrehalose trehalohydrolase